MDFVELHQIILNMKQSRVIIYGTGSGAIKLVKELGILFSKVELFLDSFSGKKEFYGVEVQRPENINKEFFEDSIVFVATEQYQEVIQYLTKLGFKLDYVYPVYPEYNIDDRSSRYTERYINGVKIGKCTYGFESHVFKGTTVQEIGSFCSINRTAQIGRISNHPTNYISTHPFIYCDETMSIDINPFLEKDKIISYNDRTKPTIIKNDVWIGANVVVMSGITINDGAIVGAGAIVTKDVPAYAVVVGSPAKVIKYRFSPEQINILLKTKWWEWPLERINEEAILFTNIDRFFELYGD